MPRSMLTAGLAALLLMQAAMAQDGYKIRISKKEQVGDRHQVIEVEKSSEKTLITDAAGKVQKKQDEVVDKSQTYIESILEKNEGKRPHKLSRNYQKIAFQEDGKAVEVPLKGKTVTIERKNGKYSFKLEEGELSDAMLKFLNDSFKYESEDEERINEALFSAEPVKVGQTWQCDPKGIVKEWLSDMSGNVDASQAIATGKLLDVYQKEGHPFGKIAVDVSMPVTSIGKGDGAIPAKSGSFFKLKLHIDACIDGTQSDGTIDGTMDIFLKAEIPLKEGQKGNLTISVNNKVTETRKPVK